MAATCISLSEGRSWRCESRFLHQRFSSDLCSPSVSAQGGRVAVLTTQDTVAWGRQYARLYMCSLVIGNVIFH